MTMKEEKAYEIWKYGNTLTMDEFLTDNGYVTIRTIAYENHIYYHKMKCGQIIDFKELKDDEDCFYQWKA